jgi:hypothetical protein
MGKEAIRTGKRIGVEKSLGKRIVQMRKKSLEDDGSHSWPHKGKV